MSYSYSEQDLDEIQTKALRGFAMPPAETLKMVDVMRRLVRLSKWLEIGPLQPDNAMLYRDTVVHEPGHVPTKCEEDGA